MTLNNELHNATMAVQTNWILKKMVSRLSKYDKKNFVSKMSIDIENCEPVYFNDQAYIKQIHQENYFIYLDRQFRIMAVLQGTAWLKYQYSSIEYYSATHSSNPNKFSSQVVKNRKHLNAEATHILMITPSMRNLHMIQYDRKQSKGYPKSRFVNLKDHNAELKQRLKEYKLSKYNNITHKDLLLTVQDALKLLIENLYNEEAFKEISNKFQKAGIYSSFNDKSNLIKNVAEAGEDYLKSYNEVERIKSKMSKESESYFLKYASSDLEKRKVILINLRNAMQGN